MTRYREVGSYPDAAALVGGHGKPSRHRRGLDPSTPDDVCRFDALASRHDAISVDRFNRRVDQHFDPHPLERTPGGSGEPLGEAGQHPRASLDQQDVRGVRIDVAKVAGQCRVGEFDERSGHLDAGRPGADQDKGQQAPAYLGVRHVFCFFEGEQHAAADQCGVVDRFEARGQSRPVVMAEIGVLRPGREDQIIVALVRPKAGLDPPRCDIDADHLVEQHRRVPLIAQNRPDRLRNIGRRQRRCRYLVKQRLE